jgi:hypothetical protein
VASAAATHERRRGQLLPWPPACGGRRMPWGLPGAWVWRGAGGVSHTARMKRQAFGCWQETHGSAAVLQRTLRQRT